MALSGEVVWAEERAEGLAVVQRLVLVIEGEKEAFTFPRVPSASWISRPVIISHHFLQTEEDLITDWIGLMKTLSFSKPQQLCRSHWFLYEHVKQKDIPCIGKKQAHPERLASEVGEQAWLSRARLIDKGQVLNSQPNPQPRVSHTEEWNQRSRELALSQVKGKRCFKARRSKWDLETQAQRLNSLLPNVSSQVLLVKQKEWCQCTNKLHTQCANKLVNTECLLKLYNSL